MRKKKSSLSRLAKRARLSYQEDRVNIIETAEIVEITETIEITEITEITETTSIEAVAVGIATIAVTIMAVNNNSLHLLIIGEGHALVSSKSQRPGTMILKDRYKQVNHRRNNRTLRSYT